MSAKTTKRAERWRLSSVTISDFRGVLGSRVFEFKGRPALIWGDNGVGKSTIALALEWTLFGGFPSRVFGALKDAFMSPVGSGSKPCVGEVAFVRGNERLVVQRSAENGTLKVEVAGKKKTNEAAEALLEDVLGLDMDTFVRAVLLQQSKIRGLLLDDVKDRNKALDRLLGMDAAEVMFETIKPKLFKDAAAGWREAIEEREAHFQSQAELLEERFNKAEQVARAHKFLGKDLSGAGLKSLYSELGRDLARIATKYGAEKPDLPVAFTVEEAKKSSSALAKALNQIRLGAELQKKLRPVEKHLEKLEATSEEWTELIGNRDRIQKTLDAIVKQHGDLKAVRCRRTELGHEITRLDELLLSTSELRALLTQARGYFKGDAAGTCPICEQTISQPKQVLQSVDERIEKLTTKAVREIEKALAKARSDDAGLSEVEEQLQATQEDLAESQKHVETERKKIMGILGIDGLLEKKVGAELAKAIQDVTKDQTELSKGIEAMETDLSAIDERDRAIRDGLVPFLEAREAVEFHECDWKKAKNGYAEAEAKANKMDERATHVENIRKAILAAKDEIASATLGRARPRAQELYTKLVQHSLFDRLDVKTALKSNKVDYSFEVSSSDVAKSGREARLVLSDGQMTAAALALFYALAESGQHALDLLYIDDPTQNLDHARKEAMAKVVVDLATRKQIVVSTQDEDFVVLLRDAGFEESAVVHHIESWDRLPTVKTTMPTAS